MIVTFKAILNNKSIKMGLLLDLFQSQFTIGFLHKTLFCWVNAMLHAQLIAALTHLVFWFLFLQAKSFYLIIRLVISYCFFFYLLCLKFGFTIGVITSSKTLILESFLKMLWRSKGLNSLSIGSVSKVGLLTYLSYIISIYQS